MTLLRHYQKHQTIYMLAGFTLFFVVNAVILATSRIMEEMSDGHRELPFAIWEPFLWEFSSAALILALVPFVHWLLRSDYVSWTHPAKTAIALVLGSLAFSVIHVVGMVALRELGYWLAGSDYQFGDAWFGFLYEYRKDGLTFILLIVVIKGYQSIVGRLSGEANLVRYGEDAPTITDRILVKKLGKEFIVKIHDIDWLESSGNYVNLHVGTRIYPSRTTMGELVTTLHEQGFVRTHRSYGINLDRVESINVLENGNGEVTLTSGKRLPISRKYRDELRRLIQ